MYFFSKYLRLIVSWVKLVSPFERAVKRWFKADGDNTYRLNYNLDENSLVFDLGGYKGDFTSQIVEKYNCNVMVFEPVHLFASNIENRFKDNIKVKVFSFGLESKDRSDVIYLDENGSSSYRIDDNKKCEEVNYKAIGSFLLKNNINHIDLIKINIEGGEYELLECMLENGLVNVVDNFQIQFHKIKGLDCKKRMKKIQDCLGKTHKLTWSFRPFVWENWEKIK